MTANKSLFEDIIRTSSRLSVSPYSDGWLPHHHDIPSQGGEVRVQASESRRFTSLALTSHPFRQASSHILPLNSSFQNAHLTAQLQLQPPYPSRSPSVHKRSYNPSPRYHLDTKARVQRYKGSVGSRVPIPFASGIRFSSSPSHLRISSAIPVHPARPLPRAS